MADFNDYRILLSSQPENERYYELLIISHSAMSKTYYLVIDSAPLTALGFDFEPANISPSQPVNSNDLDQTASFSIGDVDNVLDAELDLIPLDTSEDILCRSVVVLAEDLDTPIEDITFYAESIPQQKGSFTIQASVTDLSSQQTGEAFTLTRFKPLRSV